MAITVTKTFETPEEEAAIRGAMAHHNASNPQAPILSEVEYVEFVLGGAVAGWAKRYVAETPEALRTQLELVRAEASQKLAELNTLRIENTTLRDRIRTIPGLSVETILAEGASKAPR